MTINYNAIPHTRSRAGSGLIDNRVQGNLLTRSFCWLDAASITGKNDGDEITLWTDQSGNGNNASGSAGSAPHYKVNNLNGLPGVDFNGSHYLYLGTGFATQAQLSVFIVASNKGGGYSNFWFCRSYGVDSWGYFGFVPYNNLFYLTFNLSPSAYLITYPNMSQPVLVDLIYDGANVYSWQNGSSMNTVSDGTHSAGSQYQMALGRGGEFNGNYFTGCMNEIIWFDWALSTAERQWIESYVRGKYAIW